MSNEIEQIKDPGLPAHVHRSTDTDPKAAARAERQVAILFGLSAIGTLLLIYSYIFVKDDVFIFIPVMGETNAHQLGLGMGMAIALFCIGAGAIHWASQMARAVSLWREPRAGGAPAGLVDKASLGGAVAFGVEQVDGALPVGEASREKIDKYIKAHDAGGAEGKGDALRGAHGGAGGVEGREEEPRVGVCPRLLNFAAAETESVQLEGGGRGERGGGECEGYFVA